MIASCPEAMLNAVVFATDVKSIEVGVRLNAWLGKKVSLSGLRPLSAIVSFRKSINLFYKIGSCFDILMVWQYLILFVLSLKALGWFRFMN